MRACPKCKTPYNSAIEFCGIDGERLVESDADPLIGSVIDRYRVVERLGGGGMAAVYRAKHTVIDRECALKVLFGELASDPAFVERFRREARAASEIKHENVVEVLDFGTTPEGASFLLMELLAGRTLGAVIGDGKLTPEHAGLVMRDIALGLAAAHARGFVHRDLKPQNIMLVEERGRERAKILDFGLVAQRDRSKDQGITQTGQTLGTPSYMAPEQIEGQPCTEKSDLYSLGVILYEMLAGARPFEGSFGEVLVAHKTAPPPPLPNAKGLEALAAQLLAKAPEDRPAGAVAVVRAIEALGLVDEPAAKIPTSPATTATRTDRGKSGEGAPVSSKPAVPVSATAETLVSKPPASKLPKPIAEADLDGGTYDDDDEKKSARWQTAAKLIAVVALGVGVVVWLTRTPDEPAKIADAVNTAVNAAVVVPAAVDAGPLVIKAVDAGTVEVDAGDAVVDNEPPLDEIAAFRRTVARADEDVAKALKRRMLTRNEAESLNGMRPLYNTWDVARTKGDAVALRHATKVLVSELGHAPIGPRTIEAHLDRVARDVKRLPKQKRGNFERRVDEIRGEAKRAKSDDARNHVYGEIVALAERVNAAD